jgi:hypothetical protein
MQKTDRDIAFEEEAHKLNSALLRTKVNVIGGGRRGPFTVRVERLGKRQVRKVIAAILEATGREPLEDL